MLRTCSRTCSKRLDEIASDLASHFERAEAWRAAIRALEVQQPNVVRKFSEDSHQQRSESEENQNDSQVRLIHTEEIPEDVYAGRQSQPGDQAGDERPRLHLSKETS